MSKQNPQNQSEITAEWLNNILFSKFSNSKISSIDLDENFGPWSLLGKAVRVKINYLNKKAEPKSVIVKFQISCSNPKREGKIYNLLSKAKVTFVPKLFGIFGNGNLVLEDMSSSYSVIKNDLSLFQIKQVISILADTNNKFYDNSTVPKDDLSHFINSININMGQGWDIFKKRYKKQLGKETAVFEWMWENAEIVARQYNSGQTTLNHGDVNNSNLLFANNRTDAPILIDWQLSAQKILPFDLSYFLVKSLSVEQRRKHENLLLKKYYNLLSDKIQKNYNFDRLVLDYRMCVTRSMLSAVTKVGPKFDSQPDRFEAADRLSTRVIEAVKDYKLLEAFKKLE